MLVTCIRSTELNTAGKVYQVHSTTKPGETLYPWYLVDTNGPTAEWVPAHDFAPASECS